MSTALDTPATIPVNQTYGLVTEPGTLRIERLLPGPIERVWAHLVEPEKRRRWFADGRLEQKAGGHMELKFRHHELSRPGEEVPEEYLHLKDMPPSPGKVTRCEPPQLLVFEWDFCDDPSEVTFDLSTEGDKVRFVLTHRRLLNKKDVVCVASGWHTHMGLLVDLLEGRESASFWPEHDRLKAEYEKRVEEF